MVFGVGAVAVGELPVEDVDQRRLLPVAVNGTALLYWQYLTGVTTVGADGVGTIPVIVTDAVPLQPHMFA